ncbi:MAG: hypothetical protein AB1421_03305 [Pseudomonadota bacterium]
MIDAEVDFPSDFPARLARWQVLHRQAGPGRSYPHAWRLPELARTWGPEAVLTAQEALALDLYTLGRFQDCLAALPSHTHRPLAQTLARRAAGLTGEPPASPPAPDTTPLEAGYQSYLFDTPAPAPLALPAEDGQSDGLLARLLETWRQARLGQMPPLAPGHRVLARLRQLNPTLGVEAEALLAECQFLIAPRWSVVWLDHALDQVERFSQHHLKVRLQGLKARALAAAGELGESERFRRQAADLAERQGARFYLARFIDPA